MSGVQLALHRAALLSPDMSSHAARFVALVLIAAGVYQWLPIKSACLTHCRSPLGFLTTEWREGMPGAFVMGARRRLLRRLLLGVDDAAVGAGRHEPAVGGRDHHI